MDDGRPAILITDLYYLDHYGTSAHFPGHAVVLAGYDAEAATSRHRVRRASATTLESLARARHGRHPVFPLDGHMFTVSQGVEADRFAPRPRLPSSETPGRCWSHRLATSRDCPPCRRFAAEVGEWPRQLEDWQWCARFCYQVIERRGTGGGNFRLMYSRFLREAGSEHAGLAAEAAARWTALGETLLSASESEEPDGGQWSRAGEQAAGVLDAEERLWSALAAGG